MKKQNTLSLSNVTATMVGLGYEFSGLDQGRVKFAKPLEKAITIPVQNKRCYQNTLANALHNKMPQSVVERVLVGDKPVEKNEADAPKGEYKTRPPLPDNVVKRNISREDLQTLLVESGWGLTNQKGAEWRFAPPVDNFRGDMCLTVRRRKEAKIPAKDVHRNLGILMKQNMDPSAQDAILKVHHGLVERLQQN